MRLSRKQNKGLSWRRRRTRSDKLGVIDQFDWRKRIVNFVTQVKSTFANKEVREGLGIG